MAGTLWKRSEIINFRMSKEAVIGKGFKRNIDKF
jgi:hypothetical protein